MRFKESETLELKKSTSETKEAIISIVSILNKHQKGDIYFGIRNDGTIVGQGVSDHRHKFNKIEGIFKSLRVEI